MLAIRSIPGVLPRGHVPTRPWGLSMQTGSVFVGISPARFFVSFCGIAGALPIAGADNAPAIAPVFAIVPSSVMVSHATEAHNGLRTSKWRGAGLCNRELCHLPARVNRGPVATTIFAFFGVPVPFTSSATARTRTMSYPLANIKPVWSINRD